MLFILLASRPHCDKSEQLPLCRWQENWFQVLVYLDVINGCAGKQQASEEALGLAGRVWFDMCPFPSGAATGQ